MKISDTPIAGLKIIEPAVFYDSRGYFFESYNNERFTSTGITETFIQDNESFSTRGVVRGLHYQLAPFAQAKLVRVIMGSVYDVAVDIRRHSPTFGKWFGIELSAENKLQFYIPRGFAHGFSVLSREAIFSYKCDNFYNKLSERSICLSDRALKIDWKIPENEMIISEKDLTAPLFEHAEINFE